MMATSEELLSLKSPKELSLLFAGGEITTSKPKPDPVPETLKETVPLEVKSFSAGITTLTNWPRKEFIGPGSDDAGKLDENLVLYKAKISVERNNLLGVIFDNPISGAVEWAEEHFNMHVTVQLVSNEVDPATKEGKVSEKVIVEHWVMKGSFFSPCIHEFNLNFHVPRDFGVPGAIIVTNGHGDLKVKIFKIDITTEFMLHNAEVTLPDNKVVHFACNSWVHWSKENKGRVFFANEEYTPDKTPPGLVSLRKGELEELRGSGVGERKQGERIYDYDVYNDLSIHTPKEKIRPVLGGNSEFPYPRRCRTGRELHNDGKTETRPSEGILDALYAFYIPFDEYFSATKKSGYLSSFRKAYNHKDVGDEADGDNYFSDFKEVLGMYVPIDTESKIETYSNHRAQPFELIRQLAFASGDNRDLLKYPTPRIIANSEDKYAWMKDEEFARQALAGMNPLIIEALKEFPLRRSSAVTVAMIEPHLEGLTVSEAIAKKKLFVLDYHERLLPYIQRINKTSQAYASWTLFFLTSAGILKPVCIELALPTDTELAFRVFHPTAKGASRNWAWDLAKAHVQSNDACWHQVISHWLRTHACVEPFIIASHRQLSVMHPVNKALRPHFKNTLDINQQARKGLIQAGGIVEATFTTGEYSIEISSVVYRGWRFVDQALPNDLINRGMAVPDASAPHGLKLAISDYPYANDGLELWAAIRAWVKDHVDLFYADDAAVQSDPELQQWWTEVRTVGHGDIVEGWIPADSKDNLVQIVTIIIWVASCHHAAVNFGQYLYAGFMPNHPSMTRKLIPEEDTPEWTRMEHHPEPFLLEMLTSPALARMNMTTLEILSTHSSEEEYLGQREKGWTGNPKVLAAFEKFSKKVEEIDGRIQLRNANPTLKNRRGPVEVEYELMRPLGAPGLTNKGIPNSISI